VPIILLFIYLDRGLPQEIQPAQFNCLKQDQGHFVEGTLQPKNIYGVGLAYAKHINETASDFDLVVGPPIFRKLSSSYVEGDSLVAIPSHSKLLKSLSELEPSIDIALRNKEIKLLALLDYEAELAFVLLEDVPDEDLDNADFIPLIGFLAANDMSARSLAVMGEGQKNRFAYWGASKSFPKFTPVSGPVWVPHTHRPDAIPCVVLKTYVDGNLRQSENTNNLIYTPADMLRFIHKSYPSTPLRKGDMILTGTPGGVIFNVPRWKARLANLVGLDRFQKLAISQKKNSAEKFLNAGNEVRVSAEWLGNVDITIIE
jgi:2-keto-4-pentenoate hydratase/2-oxohepta-3-ene-1,7-dioic acid hydratase in catechol pathway